MDDKQIHETGHRVRGARVLLIEDDTSLCDYLADCLSDAGYEPIRTNDGLAGWRALEVRHPDLVVLDFDVPVISGFRLLHLLRRGEDPTGRRIPIVVVTGYDMLEAMDVVVATRPDAYLQKPFAPQRLLDSVAFLIGRPGAPARGDPALLRR